MKQLTTVDKMLLSTPRRSGDRLPARLALVIVLAVFSCLWPDGAAAATEEPATSRFPAWLETCALPGAPEDALCGTYHVAEDRASAGGRRIGLFMVVLPASDPGRLEAPIFPLAGGHRGLDPKLLEEVCHPTTEGPQCRLCPLRLSQLVLLGGTLALRPGSRGIDHTGEAARVVGAKMLLCIIEGDPNGRMPYGGAASHFDVLAALPGEQECDRGGLGADAVVDAGDGGACKRTGGQLQATLQLVAVLRHKAQDVGLT